MPTRLAMLMIDLASQTDTSPGSHQHTPRGARLCCRMIQDRTVPDNCLGCAAQITARSPMRGDAGLAW
jgi:hypothetical protein